MSNKEQTLSIIKPDAVEDLIEEIKNIFIQNKLAIKDSKVHISKDEAADFYKVHRQNLFIMIFVHICHLDQ